MPNVIHKKRLRVRSAPGQPWRDIPTIVSTPGGLDPVDKTSAMTQPVGRDDDGKLWTEPPPEATIDHRDLTHRDAADQHPISAVTGLEDALAGKQPAGNYLTEESDPTVPAWAKQPQKPSYTAEEVGALADDTVIPGALSQLSSDATHRTVTDAEKAAWSAKQPAISDLEEIRQGAEAGATAYQKPSSGIPKSDLASAVQTSISKADTALQEHLLYRCDYGSTSYNAVVAAINAGRIPYVVFSNHLFVYGKNQDNEVSFTVVIGSYVYRMSVTASGWSYVEYILATKQDLSEYRTAAEQDVIDGGLIPKSSQSTKTSAHTDPVGVDASGKLWSIPGSGGSSEWGGITGDIGNQTDLTEKLAKLQKIPDEGVIAGGTVESIENNQYDAKYMHKQPSAATGNLAEFDSAGQAVDSAIPANTLLFGGDEDIFLKILSGVQKIPLAEEA